MSLTVEDPVVDIEETAFESHLTHIVNPPNNLHLWNPSMTAQDLVDVARVRGIPIKALCGKVFVPNKNPDSYPACEECIKIAGELMRGAGE